MPARWGELARMREQHPHEQWLWRRDWTERTVRESAELGGWCLWGFTLAWNLFAFPMWFFVPWRWPMDARTILLAAFPISGALLFFLAAYQSLRRGKYGISLCRLDRSPISLGSTLRGELEVRMHEQPRDGFALRLACVRRTVSGVGKNRSVDESILWQDEQIIAHGAMPSAAGLRVPFRFDIPYDAEPCDLSNSSDTVVWRLYASADVPGIDYQAAFDLPIFRTDETPAEIASTSHSAFSWQPPREITLDGARIVVRPAGRAAEWIGYVVFFVLWYGALALFRELGAPLWVLIVFGTFGALFVLFAIDLLLGVTTLTAARGSLSTRRTWLGVGAPARTIPAADITSIEYRLGASVNTRAYHAVRVALRGGRTRTIARHIRARRDAEMLAERLTQMMGI
ncbi:MAG TPA: hypothetical protein VND45_16930 [Thermoanaerobaculia bacterium]|nr:hypothetical protein [Thermoanaerobaculia bacterium]